MQFMPLNKLFVALLSTLAVAACSGGGGGDTVIVVSPSKPSVALPTTTIEGVFDGSLDSTQPATALLLDDGSYYVVYSDQAAPQRYLGALTGKGMLNGGSFTSDNTLDFSLLGDGSQLPPAYSLSSSYAQKSNWNGFFTLKSSGQAKAFASTYNASYETVPALSEIAGTYIGNMATKNEKESAIELTITADGKLTGKLRCGCTVNAKLVSQQGKPGYDATISFDGGNHPLAGKSLAGNVYLDKVTRRLYIVGKLSGTTDNVIFVGIKR